MIKVSRDTLLGPLQRVLSVIERRHTLPILSNVLIEIDEQGSATLKATDLEVELHASLELESDGPRRVTLPARKLGDIVRALPDGVEITIEFDSGHAVIRAGRSRFRLQTLGADEFPSIERTEVRTRLAVPQKVAKWLVDKAQFSMAHQDVRYYLNGMLLEVDGKHVRSVATDGHRLAMAEHEIATDVDSVIQVIVPRKGINEIGRMVSDVDDDVSIAIGQGHVEFSVDGARLISKLIDGRFPDYRRVVPQGGDKLVSANRVGLREALARASILSNEKYRGIGLELARQLGAQPALAAVLVRELSPGPQVQTRDEIKAWLLANATHDYHPTSTCRMGPAEDPLAVVDASGNLHGLDGLMIADASIMPFVTLANTNVPAFMVAEKVARDLLATLSR